MRPGARSKGHQLTKRKFEIRGAGSARPTLAGRGATAARAASVVAAALATLLATLALLPGASHAAPKSHPTASPPYRPGVILVGYEGKAAGSAARAAMTMGIRQVAPAAAGASHVLQVPKGESMWSAIGKLRHRPGVAYALPDYLAHVATATPYTPNDPGKAGVPGGWQQTQWNFLPGTGVDAPGAWGNLIADHRPGGRGVTVAILDTGIAYRNWKHFRRSPDFTGTRFAKPYDFVAGNRYPLDRNGHGTFVAGMIAESTNNGYGLTGLAYGATVMPVRVLDQFGWGDAATIARGIRYAATHGAQVINLSLEFDPSVTAREIPDIMSAIRFAHSRGAVVVAASGNEGSGQIAYPARAKPVISVGATTIDRCIADYSNSGTRLDLVAPGGGDDAILTGDPDCQPGRLNLPDVYQMTFPNPANPRRFGFPSGWYGTSMAAPEVSAVAALVIASGVIGPHPTPSQVLSRLEQTAQPLGGSKPNRDYGYGLLDAAAATAPPG
jgi:serine protease